MRKSKDLQVELYIKAEEFVGDVLTDAFLKLTHTQYLELQMNLIDYISSFPGISATLRTADESY